jgi:signal transduction histidine kinase
MEAALLTQTGRTGEREGLAPTRILVVDDRAENLLAIRGSLSAADYEIVEARSGEEALRKLLAEKDFALVLLDVRMPDMDGFEVAHLMRRRERTRFVPIVFLTAEAADLTSAYRGYEAGAVDYLIKPFDSTVLRAKVAAFAELHQQRQLIERQARLIVEGEARAHELRVAELQLAAEKREKEVLADAVRMRDEFLALASHELNTPLTPLLTSIQSVLMAAKNGRCEPPRAIRTLEVAQRQVQRLARLVAELLEVTRLESGQLLLASEEVDLTEVVRQVVEAHAEDAKRAGSTIDLTRGAPVRGWWDRGRLEQIVANLVTNAIKYGAQKPISVGVVREDDVAKIIVRDRGIGIGGDAIGRIFDRFGRAESAQHYGGLGLGLYIVKKLVDAHGGSVRVESEPEQGSTFIVELPVRTSAPS